MPENSLEVINSSSQNRVIPINRNKEKKPSSKFNRPHCIIPVDDIQWVVNQTRTVQTLWNECWASDQYGSRWMKLTTSLGDKAFRLARQLLYTTGLFEFKRETCTDDSRKTACWLVKNLHGARRIQEFWMKDDEQESAVNFDPISAINEPDISQEIPDVGQKMPGILPETPAKSSLPEALSNTSVTSQELLKEVPEEEEVIQEMEPVEQVPSLAERIAWINKLSFSRDTGHAEKVLSVMERCIKKAKEAQEQSEQSFGELFITTYKWKIDNGRLQQLHQLTKELRGLFLEKFDNLFGIYRNNLPEIFDRVINLVVRNNTAITS